MKRFVFAAVMIAALGSSAIAQPQPIPNPTPVPVPIPIPNPNPVPPPPSYDGPPGPAIPYHKSGGRVVGTEGYYPYDTGLWLLPDGLTSRQAGYFTMVFPNGNGVNGDVVAPGSSARRGKHKLFHR